MSIKNMKILNIFFIISLLIIMNCSSVYTLYEGPEKPLSDVAVVKSLREINEGICRIDTMSISKGKVFHILPGKHDIIVALDEHRLEDYDYFIPSLWLSFYYFDDVQLEAGHTYRFMSLTNEFLYLKDTSIPDDLAIDVKSIESLKSYMQNIGLKIGMQYKKIDIPHKSWDPIFWYIQYGKFEKVKERLESKPECLNKVDIMGTPLYVASWKAQYEIVQFLIDKGADVNSMNNDGKTPLHFVIYDEEVTDPRKNEDNYPLFTENRGEFSDATLLKTDTRLKIIKLLINNGANIDVKNNQGLTPLHLSVIYNFPTIVELLIKNGADVNTKCSKGLTINWSIYEFTDDKLDTRYCEGLTPLHLSVTLNLPTLIEMLIQYGADVNSRSITSGQTPLYIASWNKSKDIAKLILENGAEPDIPEKDGWTPLLVAIEKKDIEMFNLLLEYNADIKKPNNDGLTPLHYAVKLNRIETIKTLLNKGADINAKTNIGVTPLHLAAKYCSVDMVKYLLDKGAKIDAETQKGKTPMDYSRGRGKMWRFFRKHEWGF